MSVPKLSCSEFYQTASELWPPKPAFTEKDYPTLDGKVVIVTGGNSGVGYETVKSLAGTTKAKVYIFARNKNKTKEAIERMKKEILAKYNKSSSNVHFIKIDLSDLETIKGAVEKFLSKESRLDIVIHNAGVMAPPPNSRTSQGYELQFGTNVLGPHLLQKLLDPILKETSKKNQPNESRIVWVSSAAHMFSIKGGINWKDLNYEEKPGARMEIYGQSKACAIIQATQWSIRNPLANVVSVSLSPGALNTNLQRNASCLEKKLGNLILKNARYGAYTELYCALSPDLKTLDSGSFIIPYGRKGKARKDIADVSRNKEGEKLWDYLDKEVGPYC